jgi:FdhD protein
METRKIYETRPVIKRKNGISTSEQDPVVREVPLTIMFNKEELATLVCSPVAEKELVIGFLAGEGLVNDPDDIKECYYREEQGVMWVETSVPGPGLENFLRRNFTSCCGKGRPSLYFLNDVNRINPVVGDVQFSSGLVRELVRSLEEGSETHRLTGGVHTAALAGAGGIIARYEDIGRHNALDRIMGHVFLNRIRTADKAVILSGRIASEMLIKAARIGTPVVISRSAPTGLALDLAEQLGITVAGFVRGTGFNVYCHGERIVD